MLFRIKQLISDILFLGGDFGILSSPQSARCVLVKVLSQKDCVLLENLYLDFPHGQSVL